MGDAQRLGLVKFRETSAADVIHKIRRELQRIETADDPEVASDHILNAFCSAWYVHAWMWGAIRDKPDLKHAVLCYRGLQHEPIHDAASFGTILAGRFVPLSICRLIATSARFAHVQSAVKLTHARKQSEHVIFVLGKPISAIRLLVEIDDYWVDMILDCGLVEGGQSK